MIYTVTMNASLDYTIYVEKLISNMINRSMHEEISYGGKGINVSSVLNELGMDTKVLGFTAGFTGEEIERLVKKEGIKCDFIRLKEGASRINVKITGNKEETAVNAAGPMVTDKELEELYCRIDCLLDGDVLVLAGSLSPGIPKNVYEIILNRISGKNVKTVVDTERDMLLCTLKHNPFLIKPNQAELSDIFGKEIKDSVEVRHYAKELKRMGAKNVLVSRGGEGAVLVCEDGSIYEAGVACHDAVNTVGAGDSMVAGFIAGFLSGKGYNFSLALGTAAGTATAYSKGIAKRGEIYNAFDKMVFW